MPWQVPITVDGLEYPVTFNTEGEPTQQDYDEAVQQILSQKAQAAPEPEPETPGYLSQLGSALGLGYRQMKSGVGATFNALTGDTADVAAEMAEMSKLQREQQAMQSPEDVEFMRRLDEAESAYNRAKGPLETIGALSQYPAAALAEPGAAFKTAVQSAPNALISGATSLAGYGLGGLVGGAATLETGPGAILGGLAGAAAGGALSNTLMEAGPSIFDVLNERTQGAASNMTADEITAYLQQNPDIVDEGLKTGAIRGSVIGAVEALGVKGSGRLLTMPERAAARAVQKELMAQGVDVASKEAVDKALLDPALRASTKAAADTAKNQFSSAGNMARLAGASAIETGAAGAGELAAQAAAGQDISTKEAFLEMMGDAALSLPMAATTKALEGAKYMLNPALVSDLGKASAENLAATGSTAAAEAQEGFNEAIELTMLPFTREDIRATEMPFTREDIRATDLPFTREDIRATQLPFTRKDIRATELPFSRKDIRSISTPAPEVEEEPQTPSPEMEMPSPPQGVDMASALVSPIITETPLSKPKRGKKIQPITDLAAQAPAGTPVQAAPIQPENLQSALDAHTSGPKTPEQDWQFAVSMPEGVWIEDGLGGRMRKKSYRIKKSGSEEIEFEHQVFNEETGKWEDNPSAYAFMSKKKDGSLSVNNQFPSPLQPASYTEISTGERKISKPIVVLPSQQPVETQEDAAREITLEESVREEPQDRVESRKAEETGPSDQLLSPAEGQVQEEVIDPEMQELQELTLRRGQAQNKVKGVKFTKKDEARFKELSKKLGPQLRETVDPQSDPIVGEDINDQPIRQSPRGTYYTFENGRVRTGPSFKEQITPSVEPTTTTEGMVTPEGVATQPQTTKAAEKQVKQPSPKKTESAKLNESKAIAEYPDLETFFEREIFPSGKKGGWVLKEKRTGARLSSGKTKEEASADFRKSLLWQQAWNEEYPSVFEMVNKLIEDKSINAEKYSQSYKVKPSKEEWLSILEGRLAELRQDREDTIKKNRSVGARPNTEFVDNFIANVEARLAKLQTTAAEKQTPVPLRGGTGAAGVVQSEPVEGSIPTDEKVSTETESESSEKITVADEAMRYLEDSISKLPEKAQSKWTPEVMGKARDFYASEDRNQSRLEGLTQIQKNKVYDSLYRADKAAADEQDRIEKAQKARNKEIEKEEREAAKKEAEMLKREEMRSKAIDSIIGAAEKKKRKFGQVTNSDAIAAVAMLVSSKDIPGVLTTWWGTKEDFLRDPANQTADPEIYARIKAGELVEGFFNKGRAYVFLDGIGVSDEDMLRGEQMDVSPQIAAVRRVLLHESLVHRGIHGLPLRHRRKILNWVRENSTPAELDDLAKLYTEYANWRNSEYEFEALAEELLAKKVDSLTEIPKDGPMAKLMDILRQIWDFIVGYKREPTLSDLKSVVKLLKSGAEALANDALKDGSQVKLSMIAPTAGITPEMDAEYLAAVEAGDMETAQRMVDEAARNTFPSIPRVTVLDVRGKPVEVIKNASRRERKSLESDGMVGEILLPSGETLSFNRMDALHGEVLSRLGIRKAAVVTGLLYPDGFLVTDRTSSELSENPTTPKRIRSKYKIEEVGFYNDAIVGVWDLLPDSPTPLDPVTRDEQGNVIPLSQRFQTASPDIRFSRPQFSSDTSAAFTAGSEAARSTLYSERDMDIREAIRRAYEAIPKTNSVAVPIGELFAKTEELMPGVAQDEFSNVLQDLFEDNGAVLQEGEQITPEQEAEIQSFEKDNPFNELIRKFPQKSPSLGEINGVSKKFVQRVLRPTSSFAANNGIRIDDNAPLQARAMPDGGIVIGYSIPQERFDELQKMAPQAASQYTKDSVIEELIHVSDLIGLRNQWIKSGKRLSFDQFVLGEQSKLAFSLIQKAESLNDTEAESLRRILASSLSLYNNNPEIANLGLNELLELAAQYPYVLPELVRSLIQLKKTGQLTETAFRKIANVLRKWQEIVLQWISDGYASAKEGVFGEMLSERIKNAENNLAQLSDAAEINVTTPEGRRAGFVVVMPRAAKASRIKVDGEAATRFKDDIAAIENGSFKAKFGGVQFTDFPASERTVKPKEFYSEAAIRFVDNELDKGNSIEDIAFSIQSPDFLEAIGIENNLSAQDAVTIEVRERVNRELRQEKDPKRKKRLDKMNKRLSGYWQGTGSKAGANLGIRKHLINDPRYRWMFIKDKAEEAMKEARENVATANITSTDDLTNRMNREGDKASEQAGQSVADDAASMVEEDEDAILIREGEETLDEKSKSLWERAKMLIMRLAMYARADKADIKTGSKASLSKEQRDELNAILRMPKAERDKARAKDEAELKSVLKALLGEEEDAKTPEQKKIRGKRIKGIQTLEKRVKKGKPVDVEIEGEPESSEEQVSKAEKTAQSILKGLSERYSDPLIFNEKKPNVDAMRELYKERVKQGVGPNQMTEESFVSKAVELGADEKTAGILWKAAELEIDAREAMRQDKILQRKAAVGARADAQAHRIIFAKERLKRQSGFSGIDSNANKDTIIKAFQEQVKNPVSIEDFIVRLRPLNVSETVAKRLFTAAEREKADLEAMEAFRMLEGPDALKNILREIERMRRGEEIPLRTPIPWRQLLSQKAKTVAEYRQRIFDAISSNEAFQNLPDDKKAKLADLFSEAWESKRKDILERMLANLINQEEAAKRISKEGAKALREQRMKLVEDINLGILDAEEVMKRLAEKFGIKTEFTEQERQKIDSLIETVQDETLNRVKRNKAAYELLKTLSGNVKIPVVKMLADYWVASVLSGMNTATSIALAVGNGAFELLSGAYRVLTAAIMNPREVPAEIVASFKAMAAFLKAFKREGNLAWQYLVTGDREFLDPSMNDVLNDLNYESIGRSTALAEKMAESDKIAQKVMGVWMRSVSRLLTALDSFNAGVTKGASLFIVARQLDLNPEGIAKVEQAMNLQNYKDIIIQRDFAGIPPKTAREKAILDSWAKDEMMAELDKYGKFSENANFYGQQGAMTLEPSGLGGFFYRAIKSLTGSATTGADKFLAESQRKWKQAESADKAFQALQLGLAYFLQFGAYNSANLAGLRFARFAGNKFNQGLSFLPGIGMLRLYEASLDKTHIEAEDAFTDMILRNQLAGTMIALAGYAMLQAISDEPDDEKRGFFINGSWANLTPEKKQQKLAAGQKEFTIGTGDKVFSYQNWPISSALAAIGGLSDLIRFSPEQWNEKNAVSRLTSAATSGVFAATEIPALSGFQTLFGNNLSSKDPNEKKLDRFANVMAGWGGGFVPRILKDFDYLAEPELRKYETLWEKTAAHIPIYRRYEGKEYYDILGKQIERKIYPGSREFMEKPSDPEYQVLGKLNSRGIWLTPANAEYRMVGKGRNRRRLTQEEADAYSLETGKGYRQMLLRYGQRALQMPTERARAFLSDKADEVRDRALKKVYRR